VIVLGGQRAEAHAHADGDERLKPVSTECPVAYVVLSGKLALMREVDSPQAESDIAQFVAGNYELYKLRPVVRAELEAMTIVARWLKERASTDGMVIPITGPVLDPACLRT